MGAQFTVPLITVIPGQIIASALWNNEWNNININFIPAGMDSYSDTDAQMQIQTDPFPGNVTSHASNLGGEIERIRFQIAQLLGTTFWYNDPPATLASLVNDIVPIGGSILFPSATPPNSNWLLRNGQAIGRVAYAALFALIGTTFGAGDGSTTFNIPNSTDKMPIGAGNLYALGATGGATTHTLTAGEIPSTGLTVPITDPGHTHTITDPNHLHGVTDPGHFHSMTPNSLTGGGGTPATPAASNTTTAQNTGSKTTGVSVNSASTGITGANSGTTGITAALAGAGGGSHSILNPYLAEYWMIRVL